jgi:hypothetical protein
MIGIPASEAVLFYARMKKSSFIGFILILLITCSLSTKGQTNTRLRADFTVKISIANGGQSLTSGQVFYDRNIRQLIYYLSFPEREIWLTADTVIYQIRNGQIINRTPSFSMAEFSVFHLALNSRLQDFGLRNTTYKIEDVKREKDMVITTWSPPKQAQEKLGNILISVKNKQLFGVVFTSPEGAIVRKQFFEDYQVINGMPFPGKIVEVIIEEGKESYQVTTFRNIVVDDIENDSKYYVNTGSLR